MTIQSKTPTPEYRDGWDRIFGKRNAVFSGDAINDRGEPIGDWKGAAYYFADGAWHITDWQKVAVADVVACGTATFKTSYRDGHIVQERVDPVDYGAVADRYSSALKESARETAKAAEPAMASIMEKAFGAKAPRTAAELTKAIESMFGAVESVARLDNDSGLIGFGVADNAKLPANPLPSVRYKEFGPSEEDVVSRAWTYIRACCYGNVIRPDKGATLIWRQRPKVEMDRDFDADAVKFSIYLRFYVRPAPVSAPSTNEGAPGS